MANTCHDGGSDWVMLHGEAAGTRAGEAKSTPHVTCICLSQGMISRRLWACGHIRRIWCMEKIRCIGGPMLIELVSEVLDAKAWTCTALGKRRVSVLDPGVDIATQPRLEATTMYS